MIRFRGQHYDGLSSRRHEVELHLDANLVLHLGGLDRDRSYPLQEIKISSRLGDTTRSLAFADGGKCETLDNAAVDEMLGWLGKGQSNRLLHRIESQWTYALLATGILVAFLFAGYIWGIPVLAKKTAQLIPDEMAYDLGKGTLQALDRIILEPSQLNESRRADLQETFASMAEKYPRLPLSLQFRRGIGANAFALPDGTVIATDELVELAENDQQIMAVLAHEIGHVHHRHGLRMALESSAMMLIISTVLGDVSSISLLSSALPTMYLQAHYSRDLEWEADTFALEFMQANGIDKSNFANILQLLQGQQGAAAEALPYLSSHPSTRARIARLR